MRLSLGLSFLLLTGLLAACGDGDNPTGGDSGTGGRDGSLPDSGPPGDSATLDTSFGTDGLMLTRVPGAADVFGTGIIDVVALGPKIVVASNPRFGSGSNPPLKGTLTRINFDGSIDTSFGTDGFAVLDPGSPWFTIEEIAVDSAGRIVAAGSMSSAGNSFVGAARTDGNGNLDASFGTGGFFMDTYGDDALHQSKGFAMTLLGDDIVIGGNYAQPTRPGNERWALTKIAASGALDTTFGLGGNLLIDIRSDTGSRSGNIRELYARPGGGFVAAGSFINFDANGGDKRALIAAMNDNGDFDTSFGTGGQADVDTFEGTSQSLGVQSTGDYVLWVDSNELQRFSGSGVQDTATFGESGTATLPRAAAVINVGASDLIYAAGTDRTGSTPPINAQVARRNADGTEDTDFGAAAVGLDTAGRTGKLFAASLDFLSDGRIIVAGSYEDTDSGEQGLFVARFWP